MSATHAVHAHRVRPTPTPSKCAPTLPKQCGPPSCKSGVRPDLPEKRNAPKPHGLALAQSVVMSSFARFRSQLSLGCGAFARAPPRRPPGSRLGSGQAAPARARQIRELQPIPLRFMVLRQCTTSKNCLAASQRLSCGVGMIPRTVQRDGIQVRDLEMAHGKCNSHNAFGALTDARFEHLDLLC